MSEQVFLAVDLGASSGRVLAGIFDGETLRLEEVHRFENGPVAVGDALYWDLLRQWTDVSDGLRAAAAQFSGRVQSLGVDTWGVDFGLLGRGDVLLGNPRHYRDPHTNGMVEHATQIVPREEIFAQTGLQFMQVNTLMQWLALQQSGSPLFDAAESMLMMPDLFHWLLTGVKANEFTDATTTQFFDPAQRCWATSLLERFGLPSHILNDVIEPGTELGPLRATVADATGLGDARVVVPGTHDTASAVMAVPAVGGGDRPNWCYISSGTWSLMGVESPQPVITDKCLKFNFTNEGGVGGTIRLLKNITGLWLVQECRRVWQKAGSSYSWDDMTRLAADAPPLASFIDPDHHDFLAPGDMPEAIREFCRRSGQSVPEDDGAVVRTAIESLAMRYRQVLGWLEELVGGRIETIHIVGGGTQNRDLCQATANACGRHVAAGPVEATAIGNVMLQAVAAGAVSSIEQARDCVRRSFPLVTYEPQDTSAWDDAYARFLKAV